MLKVAIVDANENPNNNFEQYDIVSVVGHWLLFECGKYDVDVCDYQEADIIFFVYAGAIGWRQKANGFLKKTKGNAYIIAGGQIATLPFTALKYCNTLAIGEAFIFTRKVLLMISKGCTKQDIKQFSIDYPHTIERLQLEGLVSTDKPYMLDNSPTIIASPDEYIDWDIPPIRCADKIVRVVASKGCGLKCKFCSTSWSQKYQIHDNHSRFVGNLLGLERMGERSIVISNDVAALPFYGRLMDTGSMEVQSLSFRAIKKAKQLAVTSGMKNNMVRIGVEGVSERLRVACGKPIKNNDLIETLCKLHSSGVKTHLFFISGLPYEDESDWDEHRYLIRELSRRIDRCIMRIKYTAFNPTPPTPLARLIQSKQANDRARDFAAWFYNNSASRHIMIIKPKMNKNWCKDVADMWGVNADYVANIQHESQTIDLMPSLDMLNRAKWQVIKWPLPIKMAFNMVDVYKRHMDCKE